MYRIWACDLNGMSVPVLSVLVVLLPALLHRLIGLMADRGLALGSTDPEPLTTVDIEQQTTLFHVSTPTCV